MAGITEQENIVVERDYSDIAAIKETAINTLGNKYFEGIDVSGLNVGEFGFVLEQIGNITEDAFNTASMLIHEAFPNKAIIPESIYSHAAIFQLDCTFSSCAKCVFIMVLEQSDVLKYGESKGNKVSFYLDKHTSFTIPTLDSTIPFTLDYDIRIDAQKRQVTGSTAEYNYTAQYVIDSDNSISDVNDPYLKIRKVPTGQLLLQFTAHQVSRIELTDTLISNTKINYPVLEFEFTDNLAGFDIFYKSPSAKVWTQLTKRIKFSLPIKTPFCYYKLKNESTLEITFSTRDGYFQPDFNSEIKIVMYTTKGKNGNFESYTGNELQITTNAETYEYNSKLAIAVKTISDSSGGRDKMDLEALQALTVESYSTATELSTESDIMTYFYNYKYRYGDEMLVIKRRDDITERLFSAFLLIKNQEYIYPTNTLHLSINDSEFDTNENGNCFTLKPGHVFVYEDDSRNTVRMIPEIMCYNTESVAELMEKFPFVYTNPFSISMTKKPNLIGMYKTIADQTATLDYISSNDNCFNQFITSKVLLHRGIAPASEYTLSLSMIPSSSLDSYVKNLNTNEDNDVRVIVGFLGGDETELGYIELYPTEISETDKSSVTFSTQVVTNDHVGSTGQMVILNAISTKPDKDVFIPINDAKINVYILYRAELSEVNKFDEYFDGMDAFVITNVYQTKNDPLTFIEPMNMMRSTVVFSNIGTTTEPIIHADISLLPLVKADAVNDEESFNVFINRVSSKYEYMTQCQPNLRNNTNIDIKFYNTYGRSNNYYIGDAEELINRVNITVKFKISTVSGTDDIELKKNLKNFIKEFIEKIDSNGNNNVFISNLIREIELNFPSVDHLKFLGINDYDTDYQTISAKETDLNNLTKEERRNYVPEMLVVSKDRILLSIDSMD